MCDLTRKDCIESKKRMSKLFWDTLLFPGGPLLLSEVRAGVAGTSDFASGHQNQSVLAKEGYSKRQSYPSQFLPSTAVGRADLFQCVRRRSSRRL